jgi:hypothetical protein
MGTEANNLLKSKEEKVGQRTNNPLPRLLTIKQTSQFLGLTTWAVRERRWAGQLPVVTFPGGKKQYLDRNDLEGFIERNKRTVI